MELRDKTDEWEERQDAANQAASPETKQAPPLEPPGPKSAPRICKKCHLPFYIPRGGNTCKCPKRVASSLVEQSVIPEKWRGWHKELTSVPRLELSNRDQAFLASIEESAAKDAIADLRKTVEDLGILRALQGKLSMANLILKAWMQMHLRIHEPDVINILIDATIEYESGGAFVASDGAFEKLRELNRARQL